MVVTLLAIFPINQKPSTLEQPISYIKNFNVSTTETMYESAFKKYIQVSKCI